MAQLYDPANARNPTKVKELQEHLQLLQRSPQGWIVADGLMGSSNPDARFMGALTFIVKINQDWLAITMNLQILLFLFLLTSKKIGPISRKMMPVSFWSV